MSASSAATMRSYSDERLAEARALASDDVWSRAWAEGQSLTLEQAVSLALDVEPPVQSVS